MVLEITANLYKKIYKCVISLKQLFEYFFYISFVIFENFFKILFLFLLTLGNLCPKIGTYYGLVGRQ